NLEAIALAFDELKRMNLSDEVITEYLELDKCVPSVAQGALAIRCRADDEEMGQILRGINNPIAEATIRAERYTLSLLDEDDKAPIGVYASLKDNQLTIDVSIASLTGTDLLTARATGTDYKQVAKQV